MPPEASSSNVALAYRLQSFKDTTGGGKGASVAGAKFAYPAGLIGNPLPVGLYAMQR